MPTYFNGQNLIQPQVQSVVDDTALNAAGITASSTVGVVGVAAGGKPNTALYFTNAQDAISALRSGPMVDVVRRVFNPGAGNTGAAKVCAVRVNASSGSTQSTVTIKDGSAVNDMVLTSVDYGAWTTQISIAVAAGTTQGTKITTTFPVVGLPPKSVVNDNIYRALFSLYYSGSGTSPLFNVTATQVSTAVTGAAGDVATLTFAAYPTIQALVSGLNAINGGAKWNAAILGLGSEACTTLDGLTSAAISITSGTPTNILANLQACIDTVNAGGVMTAARSTSLLAPASITATYLSGGQDASSPASSDWTTSFAVLENESVGIVVPAIDTAAIHVTVVAPHVVNMSATKRERIAIVGGSTGESVAATMTRAANLGSDRVGLVYPGIQDPDASTGVLTTYAPYVTAGAVAGLLAGGRINQAATYRYIGPVGMEVNLKPSDVDQLLTGGVIPVQNVPNKGFRVVQSVSTFTASQNFVHNELSVRRNADVVSATVRDAVEPLLASITGPDLVGTVFSAVQTSLLTLFNNNLLVGTLGSTTTPPFKNIAVKATGNVVSIQFSAQVGVPANYITIVAHLSAFSS